MATGKMNKLERLNSLLTDRFKTIVEEVLKVVDNAVAEFSHENEMIKIENQHLRHQFRRLQKSESSLPVSSGGGVASCGQNNSLGVGSEEQKNVSLEVKLSVVSQSSAECVDSELASVPAPKFGEQHHEVNFNSVLGIQSSPAESTLVSVGTQADFVEDEQNGWNVSKPVCRCFAAAGQIAGNEDQAVPSTNVKLMFPLSAQANERIRNGESAYICRSCGVVLFHLSEMKQHEGAHITEEVKCQAPDCVKRFCSALTLNRHNKVRATQKLYSCGQCSKRFTDLSGLKAHSLVHKYAEARGKELSQTGAPSQLTSHNTESQTCSALDKPEDGTPSAANTMCTQDQCENKEIHQKGPESVFAFLSNPARAGEKSIFKKRTHLCEECGKTFPDGARLNQHKISHRAKTHECSHCDKKFSIRGNLRRHELSYTSEKQYCCNFCTERFSDTSDLRSHIQRNHENKAPNRIHCCGVCNKAFTHKHLLIKHMRLHARSDRGAVNSHGQVHEQMGKLSFPDVSACSLLFSEPGNGHKIMDHQVEVEVECNSPIESENNEAKEGHPHNTPVGFSNEKKEYPCRWCDMKFTSFTGRERHERVHTGEKPFACSYCKKSFSLLSNMQRHERLHTGEKPYGCNHCEKRYSDSSALRYHVKKHLQEQKSPT